MFAGGARPGAFDMLIYPIRGSSAQLRAESRFPGGGCSDPPDTNTPPLGIDMNRIIGYSLSHGPNSVLLKEIANEFETCFPY